MFFTIPGRVPVPRRVVGSYSTVKIIVRVELTAVGSLNGGRIIRRLNKCAILSDDVRVIAPHRVFIGQTVSVTNNLMNYLFAKVTTVFLIPTVGVGSPNPTFFSRIHVKGGNHPFGVCGFHSVCVSTRRHGGRLVGRGGMGSKVVFGVSSSPQVVGKMKRFVQGASLSRFPRF